MRWRRSSTGGEQGGQPAAGGDGGRQPDADVPADAAAPAAPADGDATAPPSGDPSPAPFAPPPEPVAPVDLGVVDEGELERALRRAVARALAEDLGDRGDLTSVATVPPTATGEAFVRARGEGVVSGTRALAAVYDQLDSRVTVEVLVRDGERVTAGEVVARLRGPLRSILTGERAALNFLCHLSGIATRTRAFVDAVEDLPCAVRDTRKTTPGLRLLDKQAVRDGGGHSHRMGLHDALLVKDNHIAAAGSLTAAVAGARSRGHGRHLQVEVTGLGELDEALQLGVTDVLLDNFSVDEVRQAAARTRERAVLEASGNITLDTVRAYAQAGADRVAVGALTHSAPWLDLGLDVESAAVEAPETPASTIWNERDDTLLEPAPEAELEQDLLEDDSALDRIVAAEDPDEETATTGSPSHPAPHDQGDDPGVSGGLFAWRERQLRERPSDGS